MSADIEPDAEPDAELVAAVADRVRAAWRSALGAPDGSGAPDGPGVPDGPPAGEADPSVGFMAGGGHSLAAARLIAQLRAQLGVELPLSVILRDDPSLAELVRLVAGRYRPGARRGPAEPATEPSTVDRGRIPLAPTLRRIWTWSRLYPDSPAYNVVRVLAVDGRPDTTALRAALADLAARHEALRCAVVEPRPGHPEVVVGDPVPVPLTIDIVRGPTDSGPDTGPDSDPDAGPRVDAALRRVADRPFTLDTAPLWRVGLVHAPATRRSWLVLVMHHIVSDLRASDLVLADLAVAYRARRSGAAPEFGTEAPSLLRHLAHENRVVGSDRWRDDLRWWTDRLTGVGAAAPLPLSVPLAEDASFAGHTATVELGRAGSEQVDRALRAAHLTAAGFFLTAAAAVLAAWTGEDAGPEVLGLPSVRAARPQDEDLVGFLLDTLPLPMRVRPDASFLATCHAVRDSFVDAAEHSTPTFDDVVDHLRLPRTGGRSPLVRLWFNDLTHSRCPDDLGGLPVREYDLPPAWALFDLGLYVRQDPSGYRLHLVTPRDLVDPADAGAMLAQIAAVAVRAAEGPERLLGDLLVPAAAGAAPQAAATAVTPTTDLLRAHAVERPDAPAIVDADGVLDYRGLVAAVEEAARQWDRPAAEAVEPNDDRSAGQAPPPAVALPADRNRRYVIRLLACLRAGVTPALLPVSWPFERGERALVAAGAGYRYPRHRDGPAVALELGAAGAPPAGRYGSGHVLFTSGTTGEPVAVRVATRTVEQALDDLAGWLGITASDRVSFLSGPAHDPVFRDVVGPLRAGATVCLPPPDVAGNPARVGGWLREQRVTVVNATPMLLSLAVELDGAPLPDVRLVVSGGAVLSAAAAALIRSVAPAATIVNGYGCTETPQLVTAHVIGPEQPVPGAGDVPIGVPLPGRRVEVRTAAGRRSDTGHRGEIWVAGPHIADGYLGGDPAGRFPVDEAGVRWVRTGDLARRDATGRLYLCGRTDRQVLVNGYRLTLDEVEAAARRLDGVVAALAEATGAPGAESLRLWVQPAPGMALSRERVRDHLAGLLAPDAAPSRIAVVDQLGTTENLKPVAPAATTVRRGPGNGEAHGYAGIRSTAEQVLGGPLEPDLNFFEAGFTSMSLLRLSAELTEVLGREVPALTLFRQPNLRALAAQLLGGGPGRAEGSDAVAAVAGKAARIDRMRVERLRIRAAIR